LAFSNFVFFDLSRNRVFAVTVFLLSTADVISPLAHKKSE